jgi:ubiquinone/menaquinone biosynthesis C-methylase UbiE
MATSTSLQTDATPADAELRESDWLEPIENPKLALDEEDKQRRREIFEKAASQRTRFRRWHRYYYRELLRHLHFAIPKGKRVLEVGCGDGHVLRALRPKVGRGIDLSPRMIEMARESTSEQDRKRFQYAVADVENVRFKEKYDFIVLSDLLGNLVDIQQALENIRSACHEGTRVVITYHSMLWEPLLRFAGRMGAKMPSHHHNWLSAAHIQSFLKVSGLEIIRHQRRILAPVNVPILSYALNHYIAKMPLMGGLCLSNIVVARPVPLPEPQPKSVSIVLPCRNERGNIRDAIVRTPKFGSHQEFIFIDGHSTDGTPEVIREVMQEFPDRNIKFFTQTGKGKGDAVRLGFGKASGDVLMILDTDLTTPPEDMPKFYNAIAAGQGEMINGSRLVYPMDKQAMRFLNLLGNKFFSWALTRILGQSLTDTLCGTKVLCRSDYLKIVRNRSFFGRFDPFGDFDLLFGAAKLDLRILEVPVRYRDRSYGDTNISRFSHGWLLLRMSLFGLRKFP